MPFKNRDSSRPIKKENIFLIILKEKKYMKIGFENSYLRFKLILLLVIPTIFIFNCTDTGPTTAEGEDLAEQSITKNGITFYEYIDSLYKRWGFDSASNAISVPADNSYQCGLRVERGEDAENYDSVKIIAAPPPVISSIDPQFLQKDMNTVTIYPLNVSGSCSLNVYASNFDLRGKDDYWGWGTIHSINAFTYIPIVHDTVFYIVACPSPETNPSAEELCTLMNEITHQAVVNIERVIKTTDNTANWDGRVFMHPASNVMEYVFTTEANYQYNAEYKSLYDDYIFDHINKCNILQVPRICICWRTDRNHSFGDSIITLETSSGAQFLNPGDTLGFGINVGLTGEILERVVVAEITDSIVRIEYPLGIDHAAGHMLFEWYFALEGFTPQGYNFSFICDYADSGLVIHNICHELMHQPINGALGHTNDTENLMYPTSRYLGNKLRYKTKSDNIFQWNDVHN